ncbi:MAG: N-6 DNA methylase [Nitrospinae bacterium]|nr:N-6 DNA methylase [Nitrospinota bacterium]
MSSNVALKWQKDFGIDKRNYPNFFSSNDDLNQSVRQAHLLRHAFDLLDLDGILCTENIPLIYFKQVQKLTPEKVSQLHRQFWNHGGAPILVLISEDQVHIYSGMSRPVPKDEVQDTPPSLVKTLDRVATGLHEFLISVESGEFFQQYARSFDPAQRVDRDLLNNLRDAREFLDENTQRNIAPSVLDALLCRLVFTCYLFDRKVIGENYLGELGFGNEKHLKDVLNIQPTRDAKTALYKLFKKLGEDFNGDLFSDDLEAESRKITNKHIQILNDFFRGTKVRTSQQSFWPYDFGFIPIETISSIYEHFLKEEDQKKGAFYTPRFLAEIVLDSALEGFDTLLGKKFLDPACGSGIFLVGLFNRIAEEWKQANPKARNDRRAKELMILLRKNLFGVDVNPTACRITAFSLYLAYLDQLTPRDIQELQKKGGALPRLVINAENKNTDDIGLPNGNIRCVDFFQKEEGLPENVDLVVGNPPWAGIADKETPAGQWCTKNKKPLPDKQIAIAFVWKAAEHVSANGQICFVLPHGVLLNHGPRAVEFQKAWVSQHTIQRVLNLADLRQFLFKEAIHPAIVVNYQKSQPRTPNHLIDYWSPKADWATTHAEFISVAPIDRTKISVRNLLNDLDGPDAPQMWTQRFWASPRDLRFIDRLSLYPRLRDHVRSSSEKDSTKPWVRAEGFQPVGDKDDPEKAKTISLPSRKFVHATSKEIDLFLQPADCEVLDSKNITVRGKSNTNTEIFKAPHVLITKGFQRIAFADFDVSFRHALRGIHGPKEDRNLLIFLAAYLRTPLAKFFMFHTSSNWGVYRPEVHVQEILRLPMPFPEQQSNEKRCRKIVDKVAQIVDAASKQTENNLLVRTNAIEKATAEIEPLIEEYFDIQPLEKLLIEDTLNVVIKSIQPTKSRMPVPTVMHSTADQQTAYMKRVCSMLNKWGKDSKHIVRGTTTSSGKLGIGMVVLEKIPRSKSDEAMAAPDIDILHSLDRLRKAIPRKQRTIDPVRGLMAFDNNRLFIVKPIGQRYWTQTSALNDADEIAGTILMHSHKEKA